MVSPHDETLTPQTRKPGSPKNVAPEDVAPERVAPEQVDDVADGAERVASEMDGPRNVPRPIGPARLRALRELIESGDYPSSDDVAGGLFEMFDRTE